MDPALVDAMELELAGKTDMTFATAEALAERLRTAQPKTRFIPNGANFERFAEAAKPQPVPDDLKDIPPPLFGFVGALQSCIEYDFVEQAAKAGRTGTSSGSGRRSRASTSRRCARCRTTTSSA